MASVAALNNAAFCKDGVDDMRMTERLRFQIHAGPIASSFMYFKCPMHYRFSLRSLRQSLELCIEHEQHPPV